MSAAAPLTLAEEYGLPVFPCRPSDETIGGRLYKAKSPLTPRGFLDASTSIEIIAAWWDERPDALVGVPTGKATRYLVVDIDPAGKDWYGKNADRLECGYIQKTQRGHHLFYLMPEGVEIRNSASQLAPGVDIRGEGGYVIAWGAHGLPAVGSWEDIGPAPAWLIASIKGLSAGKTTADGSADEPEAVGEGGRNEYLSREAYRLRKQGRTVEQITAALLALNAAVCRPPLDEGEVRTIVEGKRRVEAEEESSTGAGFKRRPIDWADLEGRTPPERDWAIRGWLPMGHVTLLAGRGGIGKTLFAQCAAACMTVGEGYVDDVPRPLRVLFWPGEDEFAEIWRRQLAIVDRMGVSLSTFKDKLIVEPFDDRDMTLATVVYGNLQPTRLLSELREQVHDYRADYVWLDSVARIFGGNENDRHQVTTFVSWIRSAAGRAGIGLIGHPAKAGGSEFSGSTAWEGSVRSRLFLGTRLPDQETEGDDDLDDDIRYLARRKANYADQDWRRLRYTGGVFVPEQQQPGRHIGAEYAQDVVLRAVRKLADLGMHGNASTRSADYLPKLAKGYKLLDDLSEKRFAEAMRDLIKAGRLISAVVGKYPNRNPKHGLVEAPLQ
jgi:hypothetical protein